MSIVSPLPRSTPAKQGVAQLGIAKFFKTIEDHHLELHSMMLVRHGHVVAEHWWKPFAPDKPHMLFSLSKSFTSTAIGLAIAQGLLTENDPILSFFPEYVTPEIDDNMKDLQIRHLLSMSTGHVEDTMPYLHQAKDGDWVKAFLGVPIQKEPGSHFLYNTGATYMLSAILQRTTGQTLLEYLTPRLFEPLGIRNPTWQTCPRGINTGGFGLSILTEDIAKFGVLYLQRGLWRGQRLIKENWVDTATQFHIANGNQADSDWAQGYGYQFWRCRHNVYRGDGAFGQYCIVMPEQDAVLAITSGVNDMQAVLNIVWDTILPAMSDETILKNEDSVPHHMADDVIDVVSGPIGVDPEKRLTPAWADHWLDLEDNPFSIRKAKFTFSTDVFLFSMIRDGVEWTLRGGYLTWMDDQRMQFAPEIPSQEVAIQGGWRDESTFAMAICYCETPFTYNMEVTPFEDGVTLRMAVNVSFHAQSDILIKSSFTPAS